MSMYCTYYVPPEDMSLIWCLLVGQERSRDVSWPFDPGGMEAEGLLSRDQRLKFAVFRVTKYENNATLPLKDYIYPMKSFISQVVILSLASCVLGGSKALPPTFKLLYVVLNLLCSFFQAFVCDVKLVVFLLSGGTFRAGTEITISYVTNGKS